MLCDPYCSRQIRSGRLVFSAALFALMQSSKSNSVKHMAKQDHFLRYKELSTTKLHKKGGLTTARTFRCKCMTPLYYAAYSQCRTFQT